jgi:hypothetical protein
VRCCFGNDVTPLIKYYDEGTHALTLFQGGASKRQTGGQRQRGYRYQRKIGIFIHIWVP